MTKSNRNHIFIDTNIIIGAYLNDKKYENEKRCWNYLTSLIGKQIFVSSLSIAQFVSTLQLKNICISNNIKLSFLLFINITIHIKMLKVSKNSVVCCPLSVDFYYLCV